jgi:hypothetical protein
MAASRTPTVNSLSTKHEASWRLTISGPPRAHPARHADTRLALAQRETEAGLAALLRVDGHVGGLHRAELGDEAGWDWGRSVAETPRSDTTVPRSATAGRGRHLAAVDDERRMAGGHPRPNRSGRPRAPARSDRRNIATSWPSGRQRGASTSKPPWRAVTGRPTGTGSAASSAISDGRIASSGIRTPPARFTSSTTGRAAMTAKAQRASSADAVRLSGSLTTSPTVVRKTRSPFDGASLTAEQPPPG